jgi:hypothetical protein
LIEGPEVPVFDWDQTQDATECHDVKGHKEFSKVQRHQPILLHRGGPQIAITCERFSDALMKQPWEAAAALSKHKQKRPLYMEQEQRLSRKYDK